MSPLTTIQLCNYFCLCATELPFSFVIRADAMQPHIWGRSLLPGMLFTSTPQMSVTGFRHLLRRGARIVSHQHGRARDLDFTGSLMIIATDSAYAPHADATAQYPLAPGLFG